MALEAGQRIGDRYVLIERLGSGGMARACVESPGPFLYAVHANRITKLSLN